MRADAADLLDWNFIVGRMTVSRTYWLSTTSVDGQPHVAPVWGIWFGDRLHFEGSPRTKWARSLSNDPRVALHLPDGAQVVIIEGVARALEDDDLTDAEWTALDAAFETKYNMKGSPFRYVAPTKVLAWEGEDLRRTTRWVFDESND